MFLFATCTVYNTALSALFSVNKYIIINVIIYHIILLTIIIVS